MGMFERMARKRGTTTAELDGLLDASWTELPKPSPSCIDFEELDSFFRENQAAVEEHISHCRYCQEIVGYIAGDIFSMVLERPMKKVKQRKGAKSERKITRELIAELRKKGLSQKNIQSDGASTRTR